MPTNKISFQYNKSTIATGIAIVFHVIGLVGILFFDRSFFIKTSAINLLLMFLLILYTQSNINRYFLYFILISFITGISVEIIGTSTGYLFGAYQYGNVLGPSIRNVPWIIGINWFMIIYCCGMFIQKLLHTMIQQLDANPTVSKPFLKSLSILVDGATIAVLFDWLMEPIAIKLGYWKWNADIPTYNYICWFVISLLLLFVFNKMKFEKNNIFAVHLLMIQALFFLLLRTFL